MTISLDISRRVFVNENCFKEEKRGEYVLKQLDKMGFYKNNIVKGVDLDLMRNRDYKIRCIDEDSVVFEIEFQQNNVLLKKIGTL